MTLIKISNLMPSLKRLALVSVSSVCFASLLHAGITIHGSTTAYQETGGNWLTMGANDLDGSGGLGTDGYFFFGDFDNNSDNGEPFAFHVKSTPSYITGLSQGSDFHSVADEFGSYGSIDNPNTLNGVDRRGGFGLGVNGGAGANNEILTFTVTSLGAGDVVRVGILAGLEGNPDGRWDPTSITLSDGVDTETVGNHASNPLPANPGNTNTGWVFFDIDSNGTYSVSATKRFTGQGSGVGGLTFDSVMSAIDITDPTDTDGDGMGDNWEIFYFGDLSRDGTSDFDSDGRNDFQEWGDGTDPTNADVDGDGLNDGQEAALGTDPLDNDTDNDGSPDGDEVQAGTNPNNASSVPTIATGRESYPYIAQAVRDSVLVFNEIHYHPAGNDTSLEFIEIYNQFSREVDISNWRLDGEVSFDFPEGTCIPGGGYLVIAKDPSALANATGHSGALGPFDGTLSNGGGELRLYNNNRSFRTSGGSGSVGEVLDDLEARRIMDEIEYGDVAPWPIGPDGSGASLVKLDPTTGTGNPNHWVSSILANGSPGVGDDSLLLKPSIAFNEVSSDSDTNFRIELFNYGQSSVELGNLIVRSSDSAHSDYLIPTGSLASGAFVTINASALGFTPVDNDRLFLFGPGGAALIDAVRVDDEAIARSEDGTGRFLRPDVATFGAANSFSFEDAIVINEIFYSAYPQYFPFAERDEEWLELFNKSSLAVDITGWELSGGLNFTFPANTVIPAGGYLVVARDSVALSAKHPGVSIIGDYSGGLGNGGDLIVLEDNLGNPADEVQYRDGGQWHREADGGGSSLELRDPDSDNSLAEAWDPSDETSRNVWQTYTYEEVAVDDGMGLNVFHDLQIGLLDTGEFLIDDVSVIENGNLEMIQNRDFEGDSVGGTADKWRAVGTHGSHGLTVVVNDPDDPSNKCLHVVATGPTENRHNKIETTFANGEEIVAGNTYRISFRAKWINGSSLLNTKLYFNYVQETHTLASASIWGTPGSVNTAAATNVGPNLSELSHTPVVPDAGAAVSVKVKASDLDGLQALTLRYSVNDGSYQNTGMTLVDDHFVGTIPGQSASAIVRFYVQGVDSLGAVSNLPEAATAGGAFYKVQDGLADTSGARHNLRIIMSDSDRSFLFLNTNRMSNDRMPATVIENEETVYYNVALRLKASAHGRYNDYGFNLRFQDENLFRGVHESISVERGGLSQQGLSKMLMNRAGGGYWSFYDDVSFVIPPTVNDRSVAFLSMSRHTGSFWDGLFPDADQGGTLFNHELHYAPTTTVGGDPEGLKIGNPFSNTLGNYQLENRGDDKELYRWGFQIRSARDRDDYSKIIALNQIVDNLDGAALKAALDELIDVDQWMRTFAMLALNGTDDVFTRIWEHNFRFYVRPADGKIIALQWDLDRAFRLGTNSSLVPTVNRSNEVYQVAKVFDIPEYRRIFDGHINDLVETTFNSQYVATASAKLSAATGTNVNHTSYVTSRSAFALTQLPSTIPLAITTNSGVNFSISSSVATLTGNAWIDVFSIQVNGVETPITWLDNERWQIEVPVQTGANLLTITAFNNRDTIVGTDTITVSNTSSVALANASNVMISELHYDPADTSAAEEAEGFFDEDDFEFVEIMNIDPSLDVDLNGVSFTDGVMFTFPSGIILAPGERVIVVANQSAFEERYGVGSAMIAGFYTGRFRDSGEHVQLEASDGSIIADFTYGDAGPLPANVAGDGYSLVFLEGDQRPSVSLGGSPGVSDSVLFGGGDILTYALGADPTGEIIADSFLLNVRVNLGADDATISARFSTDLVNWVPSAGVESRVNNGDGTETFLYQSPFPAGTTPKQFGSVVVESE